MQCVLLAAGYATRLYPLTENMPKALLKLGDKTILDMVVEKIDEIDDVENIYVVTNERFYKNFVDWAEAHKGKKPVEVINDHTTTNDNRKGAIGDLKYVIDLKGIDDEILVMASDNIFDFSLNDFVDIYREKNCDMICANRIENHEDLHAMGVAELGEDGKVLGFEEKPEKPKTDLGVSPFYLYKKDTVPMVGQYLQEGNNPDAPGHFIPWLIGQKPVYAYVFDAVRIDIGTPESYYDALDRLEKGTLFRN